MKRVSDFLTKSAETAKSVFKIALSSRRNGVRKSERSRPLIIMANGPSLNTTLAESLTFLEENDTMSVNFMPLTDTFFEIKPKYHVLADPLFFAKDEQPKVAEMFRRLKSVNWKMTLLVPVRNIKKVKKLFEENTVIGVEGFNFVGAGGFAFFERVAYDMKLAMPRPRNVLMPSLMCGIWLGYRYIYIVGADHSWMQTLSVDSENNIISVQPHFYKDDENEQRRVDTTYLNYRLHEIVESFAIAFKSYHTLQRYVLSKGVKVYNATPGSFIDAFERKLLPLN